MGRELRGFRREGCGFLMFGKGFYIGVKKLVQSGCDFSC